MKNINHALESTEEKNKQKTRFSPPSHQQKKKEERKQQNDE